MTSEKRYLQGVGMTKFSTDDRTTMDMSMEAIREALQDASMSLAEIDAVVVSTVDTKANNEKQRLYVSQVASLLRRKMPIIRVPAVCGGGGAAFWTALKLHYNNVMVLAVDKVVASPTPTITREIMSAGENIWEQEEGLIFPAQNALVAQMHMSKFGTTHDDLSLVAYKNHFNGALNPKARFYGKKISLEEIKNSPLVSTPFNLYDCSISVNGAACAIISHDKSDVAVAGSGFATDYLAPFEREEMTTWQGTVEAGKQAYLQAGAGPEDIDVAELHDAFTIVELIAYEDLGFCKKGEGKELIRKGIVNIDGKMPVNTSGGLKARGHPISPTGIAQIAEITNQLRSKCGERQAKHPRIGLTHNIGGAGGTTTVHIFKKATG
ncbi:thiolase family protein [Candidatus Woesearchaeota archaeon]|nr:thiolase family protein [Candidatus Woesearchaeota archaeon]